MTECAYLVCVYILMCLLCKGIGLQFDILVSALKSTWWLENFHLYTQKKTEFWYPNYDKIYLALKLKCNTLDNTSLVLV